MKEEEQIADAKKVGYDPFDENGSYFDTEGQCLPPPDPSSASPRGSWGDASTPEDEYSDEQFVQDVAETGEKILADAIERLTKKELAAIICKKLKQIFGRVFMLSF